MVWFPCALLSLSCIFVVLSVSMGLLFPVCRQEAGALIAPSCHMLLQVHPCLELRNRRTERKRKQQDFVPTSWDHSGADWTGMFYFFRVLAVAGSICCHFRIACRLDCQRKKEKKKWEISHFPWTLTIPIPFSHIRTRGDLREIFLSSNYATSEFWAEGYCRAEKGHNHCQVGSTTNSGLPHPTCYYLLFRLL